MELSDGYDVHDDSQKNNRLTWLSNDFVAVFSHGEFPLFQYVVVYEGYKSQIQTIERFQEMQELPKMKLVAQLKTTKAKH